MKQSKWKSIGESPHIVSDFLPLRDVFKKQKGKKTRREFSTNLYERGLHV